MFTLAGAVNEKLQCIFGAEGVAGGLTGRSDGNPPGRCRVFAVRRPDEAHTPMDIQITHRALDKIQEIARHDAVDFATSLLRVAVVPGGCSGLTYELGWDTTVQEGDRITAYGEVRVVMDRRSHLYVEGSELDFSDGLEGKGFHFLNPQAARTCACGESFGL